MIRLLWAIALLVCLHSSALPARDWYVDGARGNDKAEGTEQAPLATGQKAIDKAQPGDIIHLGPAGSLLRQEIGLSGKRDITIDGHGCTLSGADPLPADGWERVAANLSRCRLRRTAMDRHLLIIDSRMQRMGRSPSVSPAFPAPEKLKPGEFCWQPDGEKHGWLYVCGPTDRLEWSVRLTGIKTTGKNRDITVRNLNCRHVLNDGFNIHSDCRGLRCVNITGYENFDEGFSAHEACECMIEGGRFWGNDNAVADVNQADTSYRRCEFRDSVSVEVLFQGGKHRLDDCRIIAGGKVAFQLTVGQEVKTNKPSPASCTLSNVTAGSRAGTPRPANIRQAEATFEHCRFEGIPLHQSNATITLRESQFQPAWQVATPEKKQP